MSIKTKYRLFVALAVFVLFAAAVLLSQLSVQRRAYAATVTDMVFEDDFSDIDITKKWAKSDFGFADTSRFSMRFDNHGSYGAAAFYKRYVIQGDCEIRFDFRQSNIRSNSTNGEWFALLFGGSDSSAHFRNCNAAILLDRRPLTQLMDDCDGTEDRLGNDTYQDHAKIRNSLTGTTAPDDRFYTVHITVESMDKVREADGENLYVVSVCYYVKDGTEPQTPQIAYDDIAAEGYFGFSVMSYATFDIANLEFSENGQTVEQEDFADDVTGEGIKIVTSDAKSAWKTCNFSTSKLFTYYNGSILLSDAKNGLMRSTCALTVDKRSEISFELSYEAEIASLPEGASFGAVLGLAQDAAGIDSGDYFGLQGLESDKFRFVHVKNGEVVKSSNVLGKYLLTRETPAKITLTGYYDGRVVMNLGHYSVSFSGVDANGYFGFATMGEATCEVYLDTVRVDLSTYTVSDAENQGIDFTGVKETVEEDFTYCQRYIDERKWFLGNRVSLPKIFTATNHYLQFTDSDEASFFGAKQIYTEFICRFSVTVTQNAADSVGAHIGLSFGKSIREDAAADCPGVMFGKTSDGMVLKGMNCSVGGAESSGIVKQPSGLDFWSSDDWATSPVTYRITVVVRGGKAYVYYAEQGADAAQMEICRAVLYGMQTRGYVTVSAYGGATFRLNDFSVTNIARSTASANGNDAECVSIDFSDKTLYSANGTVITHGRGASLGNSSGVAVTNKFTNFLMFLDLNGIAGDGITVSIGDQSIRLNGDGGIYSEMTKVRGRGSLPFSALASGGTVMVEALGETVTVSVVGADMPPSLLEEPVAVYRTQRRTAAVSIAVGTGEDAVLSLSSIRLYTLEATIELTTDDWEPSDDEWPAKNAPTVAGAAEKNGNGNNRTVILAVSCSVGGAALVALAVTVTLLVLRKKGRKENA